MIYDDMDDRTFQLMAGINRSARYHGARQMFYGGWGSITSVLGAVLLAAGGIKLYDVSTVWATVTWIGSAWCAIDAALGIARKSAEYSDLASRFTFLEKRFVSGESLTDAEYEEVLKERLELESREPPTLYLLNELCQISYERSIGVESEARPLPFWRKWLVHFTSQEEWTKRHFEPVSKKQIIQERTAFEGDAE